MSKSQTNSISNNTTEQTKPESFVATTISGGNGNNA